MAKVAKGQGMPRHCLAPLWAHVCQETRNSTSVCVREQRQSQQQWSLSLGVTFVSLFARRGQRVPIPVSYMCAPTLPAAMLGMQAMVRGRNNSYCNELCFTQTSNNVVTRRQKANPSPWPIKRKTNSTCMGEKKRKEIEGRL